MNAMWWSVPSMWEGQTVAILASGPSMSAVVAKEVYDADIPTIAINTTIRLAPWADVLYAADSNWWHHRDNLKDIALFNGLKVTVDKDCGTNGVLLLKNTGKVGFDHDPRCLRTGGNSGYQAIHLAAHARARRVLLLGFDMQERGIEMHWHGRHPEPMRNASGGIFSLWLPHFDTLVEPLRMIGCEVIQCTPHSALKCWPAMSFAEAVKL